MKVPPTSLLVKSITKEYKSGFNQTSVKKKQVSLVLLHLNHAESLSNPQTTLEKYSNSSQEIHSMMPGGGKQAVYQRQIQQHKLTSQPR